MLLVFMWLLLYAVATTNVVLLLMLLWLLSQCHYCYIVVHIDVVYDALV